MYVCVCVCVYVFFSSFIVAIYDYQQSTSVRNFSRNLAATFEILGARRVKWSNFDLVDYSIRRHGTKFRRPGELALGVFAPMG